MKKRRWAKCFRILSHLLYHAYSAPIRGLVNKDVYKPPTFSIDLLYDSMVVVLPMRQITTMLTNRRMFNFSKLPMRQITPRWYIAVLIGVSKLPMRQITYTRKPIFPHIFWFHTYYGTILPQIYNIL